MSGKKREHPTIKQGLHPRSLHRERYDFGALIQSFPDLAQFVLRNTYQDESIDFFNPAAVKMLNKALLKHFYGIEQWDIPPGYLCPPIPGRADYLHHMADLLASDNHGTIPTGIQVRCLDIGVGANCIYPLVGNKLYGWSFVGTESDQVAAENARAVLQMNPSLEKNIEIRLQKNSGDIFRGIVLPNEHFDLMICNPPFHASAAEAQQGSLRKLSHLRGKPAGQTLLNFGGQQNELWCTGGEEKFVRQIILQSREFKTSCNWFSSLISKSEHLDSLLRTLKMVEASNVGTIPLAHGNKISRILVWNFSPLGGRG